MAAGDSLGNMYVSIEGDDSQLQQDLDNAASRAQAAGETIGDAFNSAAAAATTLDDADAALADRIQALVDSGLTLNEALAADADKLSAAADATAEADAQASSLAGDMADLAGAAQQAAGAEEQAAQGAKDLADSAEQTHSPLGTMEDAARGINSELLGMAKTIGIGVGFKELASDSLEAYADLQSASVAMTAFTGDAQQTFDTLQQLHTISSSEALKFPTLVEAAQQMTVLGFTSQQTVQTVKVLGDASYALNKGVDALSSSFDRMVLSGNAGARQLVGLGISTHDLATALNTTDDAAKAAFKSLDQSERIDALTKALGKFRGEAEIGAKTLKGQWTELGNEIHDSFIRMGDVIGPLTAKVLDLTNGFLKLHGGLMDIASALLGLKTILNSTGGGASTQPTLGSGGFPFMQNLDAVADGLNRTMALMKQAQATEFNSFLTTAEGLLKVTASNTADLANALAILWAGFKSGTVSQAQWNEGLATYAAAVQAANPQIAALDDKTAHFGVTSMETLRGLDGLSYTTQGLVESLSALVPNVLGQMTDGFQFSAKQIQDWYTELVAVPEAFKTLHITSSTELAQLADDAYQAYESIKEDGTSSAHDIRLAWLKMEQAQLEASHAVGDIDQKLYLDTKQRLQDWTKDEDGAVSHVKASRFDLAQQLTQMSHSMFTSLESDIAKDIVNWGGWGQTLHNLWTKVATDLLDIMLKVALKPLEDEFAKLATSIAGIFGSAGTSAASGAAGAAGSVAGAGGSAGGLLSGVSSSALGWANLGVSVISGIVSYFQGAQQETTLNAIEHNTRYAQIILQDNLSHMWLDGLGVVTLLESINDHVGSMDAVMQHLNWGFESGTYLGIDRSGGAGTTATGTTPNAGATHLLVPINIHGAGNGQQQARVIADHLRTVSSKFSRFSG